MRRSIKRQVFALSWIAALCLADGPVLRAQDRALHNSIGASYSGMRTYPGDQYLGAGLDYRYFPLTWIGVQIQVADFPQHQRAETINFGGAVVQADTGILLGRRWGKVRLLEETGFGVQRTHVLTGLSAQYVQTFAVRNYPELLLGGLVDVAVARRWSLTFEGRDNLIFVGGSTVTSPFAPFILYPPAGTVNAPEGRAGFAFHF